MSVLGLVYRSSRVHIDTLGRIKREKAGWGSLADHPERRTIEGILVLRIDSLFWVNAMSCQDEIRRLVEAQSDVRALVLNLEGTNVLDTTSSDMLGELVMRCTSKTSTSTWCGCASRWSRR